MGNGELHPLVAAVLVGRWLAGVGEQVTVDEIQRRLTEARKWHRGQRRG